MSEYAEPAQSFNRDVLDRLRAALGDDTGVFATRVIQTFLRQGCELVLELEQAARNEDVPAVSALAHKLKGSSGSVGGDRLSLLCDELEHWEGSAATLGGKIAPVREAVQVLGLELSSYS